MASDFSGRCVFICRDPLTGPVVDRISRELEALGVEVIRGPAPTPGVKLVYSPKQFESLFSRAEVMIFSGGSIGSRAVMEAAPQLRGIVNPAAGLDTVDLDAARDLGLIVGHGAVRENSLGMAEATLMLILALSYQLHRTERVLREGLPRPPQDRSWARLLSGRAVGLVGFGRIARNVASLLAPFGVEVLAHHPRLTQAAMPPEVRLVDLDGLLARSDFVSLHVTLTSQTRNMIGERELSLMKPGAYLINTARGEVVDEAALTEALRERRIAGAALDNFVVEPLPADSPLRELDNVVLTPHMVGHTADAFDALVRAGLENITRILRGDPPLYCKNPDVIPRWRERLARIAS